MYVNNRLVNLVTVITQLYTIPEITINHPFFIFHFHCKSPGIVPLTPSPHFAARPRLR